MVEEGICERHGLVDAGYVIVGRSQVFYVCPVCGDYLRDVEEEASLNAEGEDDDD